ncbi:FAD-dependent oxidoreductase [Terrisporobacter hibernicus]|uniref:FAD-dependent oxidoreductase n=1 Tax=Terrisporobacter hibernicus TaxID=2813371 RepID=A0AAX2ZJW1_9FIRM|nr:FAD-dependent oxidoreductase [Terrisporobacter hibernicus]UEL48394.1 FAD-dependent oxidoreductase [Terrisporobacter hibernicus]
MNNSYWILSSEKKKSYEDLNSDISTDYLIVGGGIAGLTTAYLLAKENKEVTIVEADEIGFGASGRNTGKVTSQHGLIYSTIEKEYSSEKARLYYDANEEGLKLIESIIKENNIDCNFKIVPSFVYTEEEKYIKDIKKEYEICKELNIPCEYMDSIEGTPLSIKGALCFKNQGQFNPKKYVDALGKINQKMGVKIYENTPVVDVDIDEVCLVKCGSNNVIRAKNLILASCNAWYDGLRLFFAKEEASRSYLLCGELKNKISQGNYISVEMPTRTFRTCKDDKGRELLIAGGYDHKTGKCNNECHNFKAIEDFAKGAFHLKDKDIIANWSTQDYVSLDNIPYIGRIDKEKNNVYIITGTSKWGLSNSSVGAILIKDLIIKNHSKYEGLYNPSRLKSYLNMKFLETNIEVALDYIKGKFISGSSELPGKDEGKVVSINGKRYGAYRDENDNLYILDITCTHLGCELRFNSGEKTWDCPCHGSRFSYKGEVINGPALRPLKAYDKGKNKIDPKIL